MNETSHPWHKLAEANNLTFTPGRFLQEKDQIVGFYRGYQLQLQPWYLSNIEIILSVTEIRNSNTYPPITSNEINKLLIDPHLGNILNGNFRAEHHGQKFYYHGSPNRKTSQDKTKQIQHLFDQLTTLADNYRHILALGGQAMPILVTVLANHTKLSPLMIQLLRDIEDKTSKQLAKQKKHARCTHCLTHWTAHKIDLPNLLEELDISYYGCRSCSQGQNFLEERVIAVLDEKMEAARRFKSNILEVNWLITRQLFDFEEVVIIQANDENVERLAIQIGNDTDPQRAASYRDMNCTVTPQCQLLENTFRILRRTFGKVTVRDL